MSVSSLATKCDRLLAKTQTDHRLNPNLLPGLNNLVTRFRIWAGNVGAFAPGNASIDYRLRDDPDVANIFLSMLGVLETSINRVINPPIIEEDEDNGNLAVQPTSSSVSSSSSNPELALDSDAEADAEELLQPHSHGSTVNHDEARVRQANDIVDRLYRLTSAVRKPVSSNENHRVRQIIADNPEWIRGDLEDVKDHARNHMLVHFEEASSALVDRCISAAIFRRGKLCYRKRHQEKLRHVDQAQQYGDPATTSLSQDFEAGPAALPSLRHIHGGNSGALHSTEKTQSRLRSIALSGTNASSVNRQKLPSYAKSTALSGITRSAVARRQQLDVPRLTNDESGREEDLECPYCFRIIQKEEAEEPRWT